MGTCDKLRFDRFKGSEDVDSGGRKDETRYKAVRSVSSRGITIDESQIDEKF